MFEINFSEICKTNLFSNYKNNHLNFAKQISFTMKKPNPKKSPVKKTTEKSKDPGDLKKATLKPLKEKEKQNWKNTLSDEDEDFAIEDDIKLDSGFDDDEEDEDVGFYDDKF